MLPILGLRWDQYVHQIGVGSPRLTDITNDGVQDIIIGTGFEWSESGDSAMVAINGSTGELIWRTTVPESAYGTPVLIDINDDGILDVTASGRFADMYMLSGKTGERLWKLSEQNPNVMLLPCNFNSPTPIGDLDNDGINDFVVIQGGLANNSTHIKIYNNASNKLLLDVYNDDNIRQMLDTVLTETTDENISFRICNWEDCEVKNIDRNILKYYTFETVMSKIFLDQEGPGGRVYAISSASGKILTMFPVPENRESWSTPIYVLLNGEPRIIYGSGGERKSGFIQSQSIKTGKVNWLIPVENKGAISSPLLIYENNMPVVITNTMGGNLLKIDAMTGKIIWKKSVGTEYETYSSVAMIQAEGKDYLDIVSIFSWGVWPKYDSATMFIFDGQSGEVIFRKKIGFCNGASSPIIADIDGDALDDIIMLTCTDRQPRLLVLNNKKKEIFDKALASGGYSTPIVNDIDNDGHLDIIVPRFHYISRFVTDQKGQTKRNLTWNQYRGKHWTGVLD